MAPNVVQHRLPACVSMCRVSTTTQAGQGVAFDEGTRVSHDFSASRNVGRSRQHTTFRGYFLSLLHRLGK